MSDKAGMVVEGMEIIRAEIEETLQELIKDRLEKFRFYLNDFAEKELGAIILDCYKLAGRVSITTQVTHPTITVKLEIPDPQRTSSPSDIPDFRENF